MDGTAEAQSGTRPAGARRPGSTPLLLALVAAIAVGWVLWAGASVLRPLAIAMLLAVVLEPVVRYLERWYVPPAVTVLALVALLFVGIAWVGVLVQSSLSAFLGAPVAEALSPPGLARTADPSLGAVGSPTDAFPPGPNGGLAPVDGGRTVVPALVDRALPAAPRLEELLEEQDEAARRLGGWDGVVERVVARLRRAELAPPVLFAVEDALRRLDVHRLGARIVGGGVDITLDLVLVLIYTIFLFAERKVFRRKILAAAGERRAQAEVVLDTFGRGAQRYLAIKTLISILTGLLAFFALLLVGIPYAALFAFLTFLLNYIPTFGSIVAGALPALTAFAIDPTWSKVVAVVALYLVVNLSLGYFLEPKILGRELDLSPLVIVISVIVWGALWGVAGAFLAVPLTSALQLALASQDRTRPIALLLSSGPDAHAPRRSS